jgi:murein biosynthesis integral membrane protein MurJ
VLKSSISVISFSLFIQLISFVKLLLIAHYFGVGAELDGYYLSLVIPALLLGLVGGALQTGFMPVYGRLITNGDDHKAKLFRSHMLWLIVIVVLLVCFLLFIFSEQLISLLVPNENVAVENFALYSFRILVFTLALNAIADYFALIFNSHHRFHIAAAAPLANVVVSTGVLYICSSWGLDALIWGLIAGLFTQILIVSAVLLKQDMSFSFKISLSSPELSKAWKLMLPVIVGVALANANLSIDQAMAAMGGEGSISTLGYANRFHNVIAQTAIMSISVVLLPVLIKLVSENKIDESLKILGNLFRWAFLISVVIVVAIWFIGEQALNLLIVRGAFNENDAFEVFKVWLIYSVGLFPMACGIFYAKMFQAQQLPWVITRLAIISFSLNILLNWFFVQIYGVSGIAMATVLVYTVITVLFYIKVKSMRWIDV